MSGSPGPAPEEAPAGAEAPVVIVGAGQAGGQVARSLRDAGYAGDIVLLGAEAHAPYERPPLSKELLRGDERPDRAFPLPAPGYEARGIALRLGAPVRALDRAACAVLLEDGTRVHYGTLVLATGSEVRRLDVAGSELPGVFYLRTLDGCLALRRGLAAGADVAVIGGGYIGLEVAAAAHMRGCRVSVIEAAPTVLARVTAPELGRFFEDLHRAHGVEVITGAAVEAIVGKGRAEAVRLADGRIVPADVVVVGIGVRPATRLAEEAGLAVDDGVLVDVFGRTGDPRIFAAGDVTCHPNPILGRRLRLESWQNAQNQAIAVARALAGAGVAYAEVPWFWSDQYDINFQMVGVPERWDRLVWRGAPDRGSFSVFYLAHGVVVGAGAVDRPRDIPPARRMIARRSTPPPEALADPGVPLRALV